MRKLTIFFSSLVLSANLIANQPSKKFEIKIEPISALTEGVAILGIESGYSNFGFGLDFAMLFGNGKFGYQNPELSFINSIAILEEKNSPFQNSFGTSGYSADINFLYYLNENRRSGFSLISGITIEAGTNYFFNKTTSQYDYEKESEKIYRVYIKLGIGHKIELTNLLFVSNSIELPLIVYDSGINDFLKDENKKEIREKNFYKIYRTSRILSNFRVKLLEFRFAF